MRLARLLAGVGRARSGSRPGDWTASVLDLEGIRRRDAGVTDRESEKLLVLTTGGTIDKVYFDATSAYEIGEPTVPHIFRETGVRMDYELVALMRKDSLDLDDRDRSAIRAACEERGETRILITHGTDTMAVTAEALRGIEGKTIVLTGAMAPARFRVTDAVFNIGTAVGAVQASGPGVFIAMNGMIFEAGRVRKNREAGCFERLE